MVAPEQRTGTELLLEPCTGTFAETYQRAAYEANLPIMIFSVPDADSEMERLGSEGIKLRQDLDKPDWGLTNLCEDGCGNLLMLQNESAS